jgi:hypothetical protein
MSNAYKGEIEFEAEGKTYILQFNAEALIALEEKLDKGIIKITREMERWATNPEDVRLGTVRTIWWAGLHAHQPELTLADASALIFALDGGFAKAVELIGEGFSKGFPAPGSRSTNPPPKGSSGIGMNSGSSTSATDTIPIASGASPQENTSLG